MKKNLKTLLSIVLTTAILLTQASVFAVPLADTIEKIPVSDVFVIAEDASKRGEFEKHYLCSDGTFVVASYAEAIHFKNENGEWIDVDNEVSYNTSTQSYRAGNETFGVEFASASDTSKLVTMSSGKHVISWGLTTDKSMSSQTSVKSATVSSITAEEAVTPSVTLKNAAVSAQNSKSLVTDSKTFELSKASGGIAYDKIIVGSPEISVDYSVYRNKIEEDIYINSKTDIKSISMNLSVGTLIARVNYDNSVWLLNDEGEPEYTVGVPYMEDAAGEILNDIKVTVTQNGSNCVITYTPNEAWLNSEERVYPILLDPSITSREYSSNIVDTYVYEGNTANHSSERKNLVGIDNSKIHRTFIKIMNLPNIDPSMPVIGAKLTLTLPVGSTTGRTVALYKLNSDWNQSTITYANQPSFTEADKIGTCPFNASTRKFTFDLTDDFVRMYNEFLAGVNYGYVLKYDDESKTNPDYNATYGMEQTTVAYRPLFTVTYGYSLPTGLEVGGVYALQNLGSYGYLTVHNGTDANDVNVYLKSTASDALGTNQQFKLEYVSSTGAYRFRAMSSSDANGRVLDIVKSGGYVNNGGNVQIYNPTDELANEWFIVGTGSTAFRIVPRTNMSLSLTAYPGLDGTAEGTTPTSKGNVFVATTVENDNYQQWRIVDMSTGKGVSGGGNSSAVPNGTYYFNNRYTGKYLHKSESVEYVDGQSGLISELENTIRWTLTCVFDGMYTMRSADDPTLFVVPDDVSSRIILDTLPSGTDIPDEYLWIITAANGGGVKIQNVATEEYLYSTGNENHLNPRLPSTEYISYDRYAWRMANVDLYGNTSEFEYVELDYRFMINCCEVEVGSSVGIDAEQFGNQFLWVATKDFIFSEYDSEIIEIDTNTNKIIGKQSGVTSLVATHKITQKSFVFICVSYEPTDVKNIRVTDHATEPLSLCIAELYNGMYYFYQITDDGEMGEVIDVSQYNIDVIDSAYQRWVNREVISIYSFEYYVWLAKCKMDQAIANGDLYDVPEGSLEYYGMWIFFSLKEVDYAMASMFVQNMISLGIMSIQTLNSFINTAKLATGAFTELSSGSVASGKLVYHTVQNIDDLVALSSGKTDLITYVAGRPTWRQSEIFAGTTKYLITAGFKSNASYIKVGNELQLVKWGTAGSVRPDFYNEAMRHCVDVKNYTITTESGRNSLINNVVTQYEKRVPIFPSDTTYEVAIDVRGQDWTTEMLEYIVEQISNRTNGKMIVSFIT